jgi:hypothetical protein
MPDHLTSKIEPGLILNIRDKEVSKAMHCSACSLYASHLASFTQCPIHSGASHGDVFIFRIGKYKLNRPGFAGAPFI